MKKIIGIVPATDPIDFTQTSMNDRYHLGNNYIKRAAAVGIPIGLSPVDNWLSEEALALCDSFLVMGGKEFYPYHFQVIHHAITRRKRYLGICLGEQLIYAYLELKRRVEEIGYEGDLVKAICDYINRQGPGFSVLQKAPGHRSPDIPRNNVDAAKHDVTMIPGGLLHRVLGRDTMRIVTRHSLCVPADQNLVTINAWCGDVVEGIEYGENILGVQGHPEVDDLLPELFTFLV